MTNLFKINDYRAACKYLQDKYDALGYERKPYFHMTGEDNHLTKTSGVGRGNVGLQYHHICEDLVASLSDKEIASRNPIEYQAAENMCYCNLLEHAYLHILITEAAVKHSDESEDVCLGNGGVKWMFLALNSVLANPETSWYSMRTYIEAEAKENEDVELEGLRYNYDNLITDNLPIYHKLVNRYCTSAFVRLKLGKTNEELADDLKCLFCKRDAKGCNAVRNIIDQEARDTKLFGWNVGAFVDMEMYLRENRTALVNICTGGGKTTTALEYCRVHDCKALVLGPKDVVGDSWKGIKGIDYVNYQTFMKPDFYTAQDYSQYGVIIADEAHHTKADRWSEGLDWVIASTNLPIIGLTATLSKEQANGTDDLFEGRVAYGLDLGDGITNGNIHPFGYVQSIYGFAENEKLKSEFEAAGPVGTILWDKLNVSLNANPIESILRENMPKEGPRKIICFAQSIEDEDIAVNAMKAYDPNLQIFVIDSVKAHAGEIDCAKIREDFNKEKEHDICLINVGMVSEGAHYDGVNTLVMFRRTRSNTLYLQQLGRIVCTTKKENPHGIVFDFTNNAETLIHAKEAYESNNTISKQIKNVKDALKKIQENNAGTDIILRDYTQDCVEILSQLRDVANQSTMDLKIYNNVVAAVPEDLVADYFDLDAWKDLKGKSNGITKAERAKARRAGNAATRNAYKEALGEAATTRTTASNADDREKIAQAFRLVVRWAYMTDVLNFADNQKCDASFADEEKFEGICKRYGFKVSDVVKNAIEAMPIACYSLANNF